jgi:hypothetical protein
MVEKDYRSFRQIKFLCNTCRSVFIFVKKKEENEPQAFIILYVDDGGIIGTPKGIKEVMGALSTVFAINDLGEMRHFVGCHLINSKEGNTTWIHQPKLIKHLEEDFKQYITTE